MAEARNAPPDSYRDESTGEVHRDIAAACTAFVARLLELSHGETAVVRLTRVAAMEVKAS